MDESFLLESQFGRVYAHDEAKPNSCAENMVFTRESSLLFNHLSNRTTTEKELSILG